MKSCLRLKRIFAAVLSIVLVLSVLPARLNAIPEINSEQDAPNEDYVQIRVIDSTGAAVSGAHVRFSICYAEGGYYISGVEGTTNSRGYVVKNNSSIVGIFLKTYFVPGLYANILVTPAAGSNYEGTEAQGIVIPSADEGITVVLNFASMLGVEVSVEDHPHTGAQYPVVDITESTPGALEGVTADIIGTCIETGEQFTGEFPNAVPTVSDIGTYSVTVTLHKQGYEDDVRGPYEFHVLENIVEFDPDWFVAVTATYTGSPIPALEYINQEAPLSEYIISYAWNTDGHQPEESEYAVGGIPEFVQVGAYHIFIIVNKEGFDPYRPDEHYIAVINPAELENGEFTVTGYNDVFDEQEHDSVTVEFANDSVGYTVEYSTDRENWSPEPIRIRNVGTYATYVKISRVNYNDVISGPVHSVIQRADQTIAFENTDYAPDGQAIDVIGIEGGTSFNFAAAGTEESDLEISENAIHYSVTDAGGNALTDSIVSIDDNGILTVNEPGVYTVSAIRYGYIENAGAEPGSANYNDCEISFTLTVRIADEDSDALISFPNSEIEHIIGTSISETDPGVISEQTVIKLFDADDGEVTYSYEVVGDYDANCGIMIDSESGRLEVASDVALARYMMDHGDPNSGAKHRIELVVRAMKAEAGAFGHGGWMYPEASAEYSVFIDFAEIDELDPISVSGNMNQTHADPNELWYTLVVITPSVDSLEIARDPEDEAESFAFGQNILVNEQGKDLVVNMFLRLPDGGITQRYSKCVSIDSVGPSDVSIEYCSTALQVALHNITFGLYNPPVEVRFHVGTEETSGRYMVEWSFDRESNAPDINVDHESGTAYFGSEDEEYAAITVPLDESLQRQYRGHFSCTAYDRAGNSSGEQTEGGLFIIDTIAPNLVISYDEPQYYDPQTGTAFYGSEGVTVSLEVTESVIDEEDISVDIIDEAGESHTVRLEMVSEDNNLTYNGSFRIEENGRYKVHVIYNTDEGNDIDADISVGEGSPDSDSCSGEYTSHDIVIDSDSPDMRADFDEELQKLTVSIDDVNFDCSAGFLILTINSCTDIRETELYGSEHPLVSAVNDPENWTRNGTVSIFEYDFSNENGGYYDGRYNISLLCTDPAGNAAQSISDYSFIVDHIEPEAVRIEFVTEPIFEKILPYISLGFYNSSIEIVLTSIDMVSGVESIGWKYIKAENTSSINDESFADWIISPAEQSEHDKAEFSCRIRLTNEEAEELLRNIRDVQVGQLNGSIAAFATDGKGNSNSQSSNGNIILDSINPQVDVRFSEHSAIYGADETLCAFYGIANDGKIDIAIRVNEANFLLDEVERIINVFVEKDGVLDDEPAEVAWHEPDPDSEEADTYIGTLTLTGEGEYRLHISGCADLSGNNAGFEDNVGTDQNDEHSGEYVSHLMIVDTTPAVLGFDYNRDSQHAVFSVREHYFSSERISAELTVRDIRGDEIEAPELSAILQNGAGSWIVDENDPDLYTFEYDFAHELDDMFYDGYYSMEISYVDMAENRSGNDEPYECMVDHIAPEATEITFSVPLAEKVINAITFGFYQYSVDVTFTAIDMVSGVEDFTWRYDREDGVSEVNDPDFQEELVVGAVVTDDDPAKFTATVTLSNDMMKSAVTIDQIRGSFSAFATDIYRNADIDGASTNGNVVVDSISPEVRVSFSEYSNMDENGIAYYGIDKEGKAVVTLTVNEANFFTEDVKMRIQKNTVIGEEPVELEWQDRSVDEHIGTYVISGDGDYFVHIEYSDKSTNDAEFFNDGESSAVSVKNYVSHQITIDTIPAVLGFEYDIPSQRAEFTVVEHNFRPIDISANNTVRNILNSVVDSPDIDSILKTAEWTRDASDGDTYRFVYDFARENGVGYYDGYYEMRIAYKDVAQNISADNTPDVFIVDHTPPTQPTITYSTPLRETVLSYLTLGFYNPGIENVYVTFTANDITSGVDHFTWSYDREAGASGINVANYPNSDTPAVQSTTDKSQFSATVTLPKAAAEQLRGHITVNATDKYNNIDSTNNTNSDTGRSVIVDTIAPTMTIEYSQPSRVIGDTWYYGSDRNGTVDVVLKVTEANFFSEDVIVTAARNGAAPERLTPNWRDNSVDEHTGTFSISGDGHYIVNVQYTDRSNNSMYPYTSNTMTLDTVAPVINVEYLNNTLIQTLPDRAGNSRDYFDAVQTAVVTITEHNFDANEVEISMTASDVAGASFNPDGIVNRSAWSRDGDSNRMTLTFAADANYSFDIAYTDLATNAAADYQTDYFTVDTKAPEVVSVDYSSSVFDTILESITFGYYNAKMTVTITAKDDTSGVHRFDYSYITAADVSSVNASLMDQTIGESGIAYSDSGRSATISFEIPKMVLPDDNQFNGTVRFSAVDRSHNETLQDETRRVVVDNIAPNVEIMYSEAVNIENSIQYYDGTIAGTITINEANFYPDDVSVKVSKDGDEAEDLDTVWSDESADIHIGRFSLNEDGDYVVTVAYEDRSGNQMNNYVSNQLTIDTMIEAPKFYINDSAVTGANGGAYGGDATVSFEFADKNYEKFEASLVRTRFDDLENVTNEYVKVNSDANGGSGSFDIPRDMGTDGIYVLKMSIEDKVGHISESEMKFTINRFGSVYEYDHYLASLIKDGGQYIKLNGDYAITDDLVIVEYNADKLVSGSLSLLITRDGEPIDAKYTVSPEITDDVQIGSSGWYQYIYTIDKANFVQDGVYSITITSKDATANTSTSVPENSFTEEGDKILDVMSFTVDTTAPEIRNIVNLEEKIVNAQELVVKYTIVDIGGLKKFEAQIDGETASIVEDFGGDVNSFTGEFTIHEKNAPQTVRLVATDIAGNVTDTSSETFDPKGIYQFNDTVTVSTNFLVRWHANQGLFWGSIGAAAVAAGAGLIFAAAKRRKKEER